MSNPQRQRQFDEALHAYGASIRRVTRNYTRDPETQRDLEQEIAMALWKALETFEGSCSLRTFSFRIAHNCCISKHMRKRTSSKTMLSFDDELEHNTHTPPNAEEQLEQKQRQQHLIHAIQSLPLKFRQVISLALEECSHDEISQILGISANNVAVRLNRSRQMLRALLAQERS